MYSMTGSDNHPYHHVRQFLQDKQYVCERKTTACVLSQSFNQSFFPHRLKGQYHEDFARVCPHWKANSHINIYESLKILVIFLFRHHTNSVKLLLSVFGHGWPRWKWIANLKTSGERFQILCLYLAKFIEKLIMVCSPCKKFTWYLPLDVPGALCVC